MVEVVFLVGYSARNPSLRVSRMGYARIVVGDGGVKLLVVGAVPRFRDWWDLTGGDNVDGCSAAVTIGSSYTTGGRLAIPTLCGKGGYSQN